MGSPKALLPLDGGTFLSRILSIYAALALDRIVVLGRASEQIGSEVDLTGCHVLVNRTPELGPLSSLHLAMDSLDWPRALILHPVDHPLVAAASVQTLVEEHLRIPACILLPTWRGRHGHPVLFPSRFWSDLRQAPVGEGARWVVRHNRASRHLVAVGDEGILLNINTPEQARQHLGLPRMPSLKAPPES
jgi:CTP:molybdopterin cytidylyltransferase MocA